MGSCVSVHKDPEAALKVRLSFRPKNHKLVIPSPVKDSPAAAAAAASAKSQWSTAPPLSASRDSGSKEESFFDTSAWLESDCEDDFFSVNGDFTPSRGSTPVHHMFSTASKGIPKPLSETSPSPSPTDKKKRLSELFSESVVVVKEVDNDSEENHNNKSAIGTPYVSGASSSVCSSSERSTTNSANLKSPAGGQKQWKPPQCCMPGLRYSRSFSHRKKMESPVSVASVG